MNLSPEDVERIAVAVLTAMDDRRGMTSEQHEEDHLLMRAIAKERNEKADLYRSMKETVVQWGIIGLLSALGMLAWFFMTHTFATVAEKAT